MTYSEKLKDPRWQKKRLEILNRDNFTCQSCGDDKTELNVHHFKYSGNPWDSEDDQLITYCKSCHLIAEYLKDEGRIIRATAGKKTTKFIMTDEFDDCVFQFDTKGNHATLVSCFTEKMCEAVIDLIKNNKSK